MQLLRGAVKNPIKNDFVGTCKKYLECLEINLTFEAIKSLSKWKFKRLMKEKIEKAAFNYLIGLKNKTGRDGRVSKIAKIKYERLEIVVRTFCVIIPYADRLLVLKSEA